MNTKIYKHKNKPLLERHYAEKHSKLQTNLYKYTNTENTATINMLTSTFSAAKYLNLEQYFSKLKEKVNFHFH